MRTQQWTVLSDLMQLKRMSIFYSILCHLIPVNVMHWTLYSPGPSGDDEKKENKYVANFFAVHDARPDRLPCNRLGFEDAQASVQSVGDANYP